MTRSEAERLAEERARARSAGDFSTADALRERIGLLGFDVLDAAAGWSLVPRAQYELVDPDRVTDRLGEAPSLDATIHLLYEGFRLDLERALAGFEHSGGNVEVVILDNGSAHGEWLESLTNEHVRVLHLVRELGWAEARNVAARISRGRILVFADLSVEPTGDVVSPLVRALSDPGIGVCGPWGLATGDLRQFTESAGPEVDAIEGYLLGLRREVFARVGFDPWFRWYRHADIDLSFGVRALGLAAVVVPVPALRHEHRGWSAVPEPDRPARSKRNFYRFLDHWRDREDLLVSRRELEPGPG